MATKRSDHEAGGRGETELVERLERPLLNRREFVLGAVVGAAGASGVAAVSAMVEGPRIERLATLASGTGAPSSVRYHVPAVDGGGDGLVLDVTATVEDGAGDVYANLDDVEVRHDAQLALLEATATAESVTGSSLGDRNLLVSFESESNGRTALRGKSWEAGLFVAVAGALTSRQPPRERLVTGLLGSEGELLPVGGVEAKARAARAFGAEVVYVPPDLAVDVPGIAVESVPDAVALFERIFE